MKIVLQDINDNFPSFEKMFYTVTISEATEMNTSVITVKVIFQSIEHTILLNLFSNAHKLTVILNYLFLCGCLLLVTTAIEQVLKRECNEEENEDTRGSMPIISATFAVCRARQT